MDTKRTVAILTPLFLIAMFAGAWLDRVQAQSYGSLSWGVIAPTLAQCPPGTPNMASLCDVGTSTTGYALYVSHNGGTYQLLVPAAPAPTGVATFNGRTGNVVLTKGDVTATGLTATTTLQ